MIDWRTNIKDHDTLYDLDIADLLVFIRHECLTYSKGMALEEPDLSIEYANAAMNCQAALENILSKDNIIKMTPSM